MRDRKTPRPWPLPLLIARMAHSATVMPPAAWAEFSGWPVEVVSALVEATEAQVLAALPPDERGKALRALRKAAGLLVREAAPRAGVSENAIWRWETGENCPTPDLLACLLAVYGR